MGRLIVTSDIHGAYYKFLELLEKCEYSTKYDKLVIIGDIINKGKNSKQVFEKIKALQRDGDVIVTKGNNDQYLCDFIKYGERLFTLYGGSHTLVSFENDVDEVVRWINKLPYYYETDKYIFTHAGIKHGVPLSKQDKDDFLNIREEFFNYPNKLNKTIIFGHSTTQDITGDLMQKEPLFWDGKIAIDTAGVADGRFTALIIDENNNITYEQVEGGRE